jgi:heme/copper-type cytochrome/quinol oxidase subunit 4
MHESRVQSQKTMGRFWAIASILILNGALTLIAVYMMAKGEASILGKTLESIGK